MTLPNATVTQCAILVGGLGSRLGGLTARTPKPLLRCGDRPFLAWLMREFIRYGVTDFLLLTGHLSAEVERSLDAVQASLPRRVRIGISPEPHRAGTAGALFHARDRLEQRFLLCNGDSLFDGNLAVLLADAAGDEADVVGRLMLRRVADASRYGVVSLDGDRIASFQARPPDDGGGTINGGIYLFRDTVLDRLTSTASLEIDTLPVLAAAGALRGTLTDGYFRDIGLPEALAAAQTEIPALVHRKAVFLDRDGVINIDHGYVGSHDRFQWVDGARDAIRYATSRGWHVFIVTNQSGVARGLYDEAAVQALLGWIADAVRRSGGTVDDWRYCPFHPHAAIEAYRQAHEWRKPLPGMLLDLMRAWRVDPSHAVMIGDQASDMAAAAAAGVTGHHFAGGNLLSFLQPIVDNMS